MFKKLLVSVSRKVGDWWVRIARRSPRVMHGLATTILTIFLRIVMYSFGLPFPAPDLIKDVNIVARAVGEGVLDALLSVIVFSFIIQFTRFSLGPLFPALALLNESASGRSRGAILGIAGRQLEKVRILLTNLRSENGACVDRADASFATRVFFENAHNGYDGTDSHLPSEFSESYPDYLDAHAKNLEVPGNDYAGTRILIASGASLVEDADHHPDEYYDFVNWHKQHGVELRHADPAVAEDLIKQHELPTTDIGIWHGEYAALFSPKCEGGQVLLKMVVQEETLFKACEKYFRQLKRNQGTYKVPFQPELFEEPLANRWEDFVNPQKRLELEEGFLLPRLEPFKSGRILDAAAGIGCESAFLSEHGFDVTSNEIGRRLSEIARANAKRKGIGFEHIAHDWRRLLSEYPQPKFDVILVLGNSLCLLLQEVDRRLAVESFFHILRPGGMIMIDERNFPRILRSITDLRKDAVATFEKMYKGTVMYCGETVKGCPDPDRTTTEKVVFAYYDNSEQKSSWDEAKKTVIERLEMHPFAKGEVPELLHDCGFRGIETYSDLAIEEGYNTDADFFSHVAFKPSCEQDGEAKLSETSLLVDLCKSSDSWQKIGSGEIVLVAHCPHMDGACIKKTGGGDPSGGFQMLKRETRRGLILSAEFFHPSKRVGGPADRFAIENEDFNGYGFCLTDSCRTLLVERRDMMRAVTLSTKKVNLKPETWYKFSLSVGEGPSIVLRIYDESGAEIETLDDATDTSYDQFDRVAIHGGAEYYVRKIEVVKT